MSKVIKPNKQNKKKQNKLKRTIQETFIVPPEEKQETKQTEQMEIEEQKETKIEITKQMYPIDKQFQETYNEELTKLQKRKPFKFQKKKLQLYDSKLEELEKKINELYERLEEEDQFLDTKYNSIITTNSTKLNEMKKIA